MARFVKDYGFLLRQANKTVHNTFFLILYEMGLEDRDVLRIMGITQEAIRILELRSPTRSLSTRYRIFAEWEEVGVG